MQRALQQRFLVGVVLTAMVSSSVGDPSPSGPHEGTGTPERIVNAADHGLRAGDDAVPALRTALAACGHKTRQS
jgi:hypothetical protein